MRSPSWRGRCCGMAAEADVESTGTAPWSPRRRRGAPGFGAPAPQQAAGPASSGAAQPGGGRRRAAGGAAAAEAGRLGGARGDEGASAGAARVARQAKEARLRNVLAAWLSRRPGAYSALHEIGDLYKEQPAARVEIRSVGGLQTLIDAEPNRFDVTRRPGSDELVGIALRAPAAAAAPSLSSSGPPVSSKASTSTRATTVAAASSSEAVHGLQEIKRQLKAELSLQDDRLRAHDAEFASATASVPPATAAAAADPGSRAAAQLARWLEGRPGHRCAAVDMPLFYADPAHADARAAIRPRTLLAFLRTYSSVFEFHSSGSAVLEFRLRQRHLDPEQERRVDAAESAWISEAPSFVPGPSPDPPRSEASDAAPEKRRASQLRDVQRRRRAEEGQVPAKTQVADAPILAAVSAAAEVAVSHLLSQLEPVSASHPELAAHEAGASSPIAAVSRSSIAKLIERFRTAPPTEPEARSSIVDLVWWSKAASPASGVQPRAPFDHPEAQLEPRHHFYQPQQGQCPRTELTSSTQARLGSVVVEEPERQEQQQRWPREVAISDPLPALYPEMRSVDTSDPPSPTASGGSRGGEAAHSLCKASTGAQDAAPYIHPICGDDDGGANGRGRAQCTEADVAGVAVDAGIVANSPGCTPCSSASTVHAQSAGALSRKRVRLLWDVENVSIPARKSAFSMATVLLGLSARLGLELWRQGADLPATTEPPACRLFVYHNPEKHTLSRIARKELVAAAAVLVDVGKDKIGAADLAIMSEMETVASDWDPEDVLLVLISSDTDFVDTIRRLAQRGFRVAVLRANYAGAGSLAASSFELAAWRVLDFQDSVLSLTADRLPRSDSEESSFPAAHRVGGAELTSSTAVAPRGGRGRGPRTGQRVVRSSPLKAPPAPPRAIAPVPSVRLPAPAPLHSPTQPLSKSARTRANRARREAALREQVEIAEEASAQASAHEAALRAQVEIAEQASAQASAQALAQAAAAESERIAGAARANVAALRAELCARLESVVATREQAATTTAASESFEPEAVVRPRPLWLPSPEQILRQKQAQSHAEVLANRIRDEIAKARLVSAGVAAAWEEPGRSANNAPLPASLFPTTGPASPLSPAAGPREHVLAYVEREVERQQLDQRSVQLLYRIKELRLEAERAVRPHALVDGKP